MFKLESYVTPLIMGYIDQYVALKQEDFQLSLWGGDAVLNKLDLRLDVIEKAIHLPVTFKSGHIHELRLHVPWTALGSEPVIITINTIECVLKLRDSAHESASQTSEKSQRLDKPSSRSRKKPKPPEEPDLPPGYIQGLINRILNNVNIVVNNLILKFVEDDIVLSVNVKSAEIYSANSNWMRDFVDLAVPDLALRRVIDFSDLTICLDKRNASGKIETYQDPLLYRCPVTCRIHSQYDGLYSKYPTTTKMNFLCEKLDLSLTDTQVPMFFRLLELCIAIYYGTLKLPDPTGSETSEASYPLNPQLESSVDPPASDAEFLENDPEYPQEGEDGWVSWAWSYVPQILPTEDDYEFEDEAAALARRKNEPSCLVVGFCINKGSLTFKLTETVVQDDYFGPSKVNFKPCMAWHVEGVSMQTIIRGLEFFDVQFGVTSTRIECLGLSISGNKDTDDPYRNPVFFTSGSADADPTLRIVNFTTDSLFDPGGAENSGERAELNFDTEKHQQMYTETYGLKKYGAFWMDYLYTMERGDSRPGSSKSSTASGTSDDLSDHRENSCMRMLVGPAHLCVSSSMVQRLHKFVHCALKHDYEPYSVPPSDDVEELRTHPTEEEVAKLEEFVATRSQHFTFLQPRITILAADLPEYDVSKKLKSTASHLKQRKKKEAPVLINRPHTLPCGLLQADRVDIQVTSTMYAKHLVKTVSALGCPPAGLLHHCHSHSYFKIFGLSTGLSALDPTAGFLPPQTLIQPFNVVYYFKRLLLPQYWKNPLQPKTETTLEVPQLAVNAAFPQIFLCIHIAQSWQQRSPDPAQLEEISLLQDTFNSGKPWPYLRLVASGMELKRCQTEAATAYSATLSSLQVTVIQTEKGTETFTPVVYGPLNTADVHSLDFFTRSDGPSSTECLQDLFNATVQIPTNPIMPQTHAAIFLNVQGIVGCFDPVLTRWLRYKPAVNIKSRSSASPVPSGEKSPPKTTKGSQDGRSDSTVTAPTESLTHSQTYNQTHASSKVKDESLTGKRGSDLSKSENLWGEFFADVYPLVKIIQVQVDINSWCAFLPLKPLRLSHPSVNIAHSVHQEYKENGLPPTAVISCPRIRVCSAGHKPISPVMDIPIRSLEHSVAGEKLPWSLKLSNASLYTVNENQQLQHGVKPLGVSATLAVTTKYHPPTSDNITALGLCVHADMDNTAIFCSKPQVTLIYNLMTGYAKLAYDVADSLQVLKQQPAVTAPVVKGPPRVATSKTPPSVKTPPDPTTDPALMSITETSDTFSQCPSPSEELEDGVKLSLWVQWTLPKIMCKLYSKNSSGQDLCLLTELEDLSSAIDVQSVYAKIKCKTGCFNVCHRIKEKDGHWRAGSLQGVLLSCSDQLVRPLQLVSNKGRQSRSPSVPNLFHAEEQKPRDHGFLNLTFTRAQRKSVKQKLKKASIEGMLDVDTGSGLTFRDNGSNYLNEVCLNVEPCDVVLNCPVLSSVLDVFSVGPQSSSPPPSPMAAPSQLPLITSSSLPLIYISAANFRVFIPTCDDAVDGVDLCVLQVNAVNLQPHADNPLSRIVQDQEIHKLASQAGLLHQPGSQVEDRQYQLDICALSIASGCWKDVISKGNRSAHTLLREPVMQNPALEWNMQQQTTDEMSDPKLIPMASPFDLRIVVAPAVVYIPKDNPCNASLVCGHSLELNATSDMDFLLSIIQMQLFSSILNSNIALLINRFSVTDSRPIKKRTPHVTEDSRVHHDSGIESEASTLTTIRSQKRTETCNTNWASTCTPFHVFLTAGKISCMLYGHRPLTSKDEEGNKLFPYLFMNISQPHTWISCGAEQKFELSCFDLALKGAKTDACFEEEGKWIPDPLDFNVPWMETRPGCPQKKTGIPPSLYTIHLTDFLLQPARMEIMFERPIKFNVSIGKGQQLLSITKIFTESLEQFSMKKQESPAKPTAPAPASDPKQLFAFFKSIHFSTVQVVVAMETIPHPKSPGVCFSVSGIDSDIALHSLASGHIASVETTWASDSPVFLAYVDCGLIRLQFGQENYLCLQMLAEHLNEFTQSVTRETEKEAIGKKEKKKNKGAATLQILDQSVDDLRAGNLDYVNENVSLDELPQPEQIMFGFDYDTGSASMSWCYPEPRVLTRLTVTPVPFTIPRPMEAEFVDETFKVPCTLQYYNLLTRSYENYFDLTLSESESSEVHLPEVKGHDPFSTLSASQLWRVLIHRVRSEDEEEEEEETGGGREEWLEPAVSPMTLAASIHVDSCSVPSLVPVVQCAVNVGSLQLSLCNHFSHLGSCTPSKLFPFEVSDAVMDHEWMKINLNSFTFNASVLSSANHQRISTQASAVIETTLVEYRNLTMHPLMNTTNISGKVVRTSKDLVDNLKVELSLGSMSIQVGQAAVHSLNTAALAWQQVNCAENASRIVPHHYIICNDTQEAIRIRQVETDESLTINSREALPYAWSALLEDWVMQFSVQSIPDAWTVPVSLDVIGTNVCSIGKGGTQASLVVRVRPITNCQMQVIITGSVTLASRLSQSLDVRISSSRVIKESDTLLCPGGTLASFVCTNEDVKSVRVRLHGDRNPWSQEIVFTDHDKEIKLTKLSSHDKATVMHVWCHIFAQTHRDLSTNKEDKQHLGANKHITKMMLFSPLFIVRNQLPAPLLMNIHTPRLKTSTQLEVEGRGLERQLHMVGGGDLSHNITYQLNPQMKPSSPPVTLSSGLIEQMSRVALDHFDIDAVAYEWANAPADAWPYNHMDSETIIQPTPRRPILQDIVVPQASAMWTPPSSSSSECNRFPDIELQIQLSQKWPGCNTVLIDVVPYMLLVNQTTLDLKVIDIMQEEDWMLPTGMTFAPPTFQGCLSIAVVVNDLAHSSDPLTFSQEDNESRYLPSLPDVLYLNSHLSVSIPIRQNGKSGQICHLALHSTLKKGIRVITISERFCISNWTPFDFHTLAYSLRMPDKVQLLHDSEEAVFVPHKGATSDESVPLIFWQTASEESNVTECVQYVTIKNSLSAADIKVGDQFGWSHPARLAITQHGSRQTLAVNLKTGPRSQRTKCLTLTCQERHSVVYLTLCEDHEPPVHLHNQCSFPLYFGQAFNSKELVHDATVQEEKELILSLPFISPFSSMFYSFPEVDSHFPEIQNIGGMQLKLHLGGYHADEDSISWSGPIDLGTEHALFAQIDGISDLKVQVAKEGNTVHVYVEPVSRAEVSAKEIRSRLRGGKENVRTEKVPAMTNASVNPQEKETQSEEQMELKREQYLDLNILCTQVTVMLLDDIHHDRSLITEMLCLTADNVGFSCYPKLDIARSTSSKPKYDQSVVVCVGDLQVDNQLYGTANFDFPVLLMASANTKRSELEHGQFADLSLEEKLGILMNHGIICVTFGFYKDIKRDTLTLQTAKLVVQPLQVYVEDIFVYELLKEFDRLIPTRLLDSHEHLPSGRSLPRLVRMTATALNHPIRMENVCIEPMEMLVSLHASLKVFLASDNTPLKFGRYEKSLFTSYQQLARSLTMYYASGALFRAGLVVGSLEILGNPTGLARHLSQGVADLFRMPYQGLTRGPGAFIGGVTRGMGSLLRHVSTGTLNSITSFASSVSRNMERLSLDADHLERQEQSRRHKPTGVSQGLANGLSGFGISLLGAIAGIADQPLQSLTRPAPSRTRAATGLVSGVGKGLVGVVTKPIGGAAELVSQAGMGLMQGTGLSRYPSVRHKPLNKSVSEFLPSQLKPMQKQMASCSSRALLTLPARFCPASSHDPVTVFLLLTAEILFVLDEFADEQDQAHSLTQISCQGSAADPTLLLITPKHRHTDDATHDERKDIDSKDRIAQFIAMGTGDSEAPVLSEKASSKRTIQLKFQVDALSKDLFLAMFMQAQRKLKGHGFII
ncbi:hypothetical protein CAPTEDRAFT_228271 [Capitella teleta]|uniref:Vacuolar protein sorting-associated protein 13B n=1 Tax=Capitella teleta TaxID=283909 RepID=R7TEM8_CAPTE|nr:hypothetical protein CAPTEDRAFT_228271 [Capitella teleta]|eukprot:ELT92184.1 hypothetical protein CAPTEDRAFT_228271 [Capitella teleta]